MDGVFEGATVGNSEDIYVGGSVDGLALGDIEEEVLLGFIEGLKFGRAEGIRVGDTVLGITEGDEIVGVYVGLDGFVDGSIEGWVKG